MICRLVLYFLFLFGFLRLSGRAVGSAPVLALRVEQRFIGVHLVVRAFENVVEVAVNGGIV